MAGEKLLNQWEHRDVATPTIPC